ncbi:MULTISPECIES: hypothetical protein [Lysinibacillus]|jgi:hypothetical protein|nr:MULTISPECIES: hypothetical protein [Lysinibacillus]
MQLSIDKTKVEIVEFDSYEQNELIEIKIVGKNVNNLFKKYLEMN